MESHKAQKDIGTQIQQLKSEQLKNINQVGKAGVGVNAPTTAPTQAPFPNMGTNLF